MKPTSLTPELAVEICARLAAGRTVTDLAKDEAMPDPVLIYRWYQTYPEFRSAFQEALHIRGHTRFDQVNMIVEGLIAGNITPNVAKTAGDLLKWLCSKDNFESYGEKSQAQITGPNGTSLEVVMRGILSDIPPAQDVKIIENIPPTNPVKDMLNPPQMSIEGI